jgi:transcriptional regulator with XRE-family HTH domain
MKENSLASWREKLGFNQQSLADYLGLSRSLIALVERGERSLPTQALLQFNELVLAYEQAKETQLPLEWSQQARQDALESLRVEIKDVEYTIYKKQREFQALNQTYQQLQSRLKTLFVLQSHLKQDSKQAYQHQLWLEIQVYEATKQLHKMPYEALIFLAQTDLQSLQGKQQMIDTQIKRLEEN